MEIGTWSNEMAEFGDSSDSNFKFPDSLSMVRKHCFYYSLKFFKNSDNWRTNSCD